MILYVYVCERVCVYAYICTIYIHAHNLYQIWDSSARLVSEDASRDGDIHA